MTDGLEVWACRGRSPASLSLVLAGPGRSLEEPGMPPQLRVRLDMKARGQGWPHRGVEEGA
jgi:hypothetical protein